MTHRDLITMAKFKLMGFKILELKYIPDIKLNRILCSIQVKVGRKFYPLEIECFGEPQPKVLIARHILFQEAIKSLEEFMALSHKDKLKHFGKEEEE